MTMIYNRDLEIEKKLTTMLKTIGAYWCQLLGE